MTKTIHILWDDLAHANLRQEKSGADHQLDEQPSPTPKPKDEAESKSIFEPHLELGMP